MTEAEWLACHDPRPMLDLLHDTVSARKLRLFLRACRRECWGSWQGKATRLALECVDHLAESGRIQGMQATIEVSSGRAVLDCGASERLQPLAVATGVGKYKQASVSSISSTLGGVIESLGCAHFGSSISSTLAGQLEHFGAREVARSSWPESFERAGLALARQADLLRDLVRGGFRPLLFRADWRTMNGGAARLIAREIYDRQDFEQMPILADARQDAGCDSDEIIEHLRNAGPHARGCWVVDTVLAVG